MAWPCRHATRLSSAARDQALAPLRALATKDPVKARAMLDGLEVEMWKWRRSIRRCSPRPCASAASA
jgi:hypothetical protein